MRSRISSLFILICILVVSFIQCEKKVDFKAEEKAISDLLETFIKAWENLDINTLESIKSHEPYSSMILLNNRAIIGWDSIKIHLNERFQRLKQQQDFSDDSEILDLNIYAQKSVAYATFKMKMNGREDGEDYSAIINKIFFVFEKNNDNWKIVFEGYAES